MKPIWIPVATTLAVVMGPFAARGQLTAAAAEPESSFVPRIGRYLEARARSSTFSAAILVASKGKVVLRAAYGMADFELGVPLRPDHVFRIGSLTKPFTATAVLKLRDQGRVSLSQEICHFLQSCPPGWESVTLTHILTHSSGIPDLFGDLQAVPVTATRGEVDRLLGTIGVLPLKALPGSQYAYSNFNYVLLGYMIEVVTGEPWEAYLLSQVLAPARTAETRYDDVWAVVPRRVHGYALEAGQLRVTRYTDHAAYAAGGLSSTLDDLRRWHDAYWAGTILPKASVAEALTPGLGDYGYGWQITRQFGRPVHNHTGGLRGFASHLVFYPDQDLLIIILSNIEQENTKGTACDIAALALEVVPTPLGTPEWIERSNDERCGTLRPST